jgi:phosphoribosyl-ATP pyrophosphohydrolase/phosphoribosyl-AMP cyclohydrolase
LRKERGGEESYTRSLFEGSRDRRSQKVGEEGVELALAGMMDDGARIRSEAADLLFHMMVLLESCGESMEGVCEELRLRHEERARGRDV